MAPCAVSQGEHGPVRSSSRLARTVPSARSVITLLTEMLRGCTREEGRRRPGGSGGTTKGSWRGLECRRRAAHHHYMMVLGQPPPARRWVPFKKGRHQVNWRRCRFGASGAKDLRPAPHPKLEVQPAEEGLFAFIHMAPAIRPGEPDVSQGAHQLL